MSTGGLFTSHTAWRGLLIFLILTSINCAGKNQIVNAAPPAAGGLHALDVAGPWQQQALEVTGNHGVSFGEHCDDFTVHVSAPVSTHLETNTDVVKKDEHTHWELSNVGPDAHWHYCADNCTFSCDTISIIAKWRFINETH